MDVGQDWQSDRFADLGEDGQTVLEADPPLGLPGGPVRLVERGLVDQADVQPIRRLFERECCFQRVGAALHLAGPGDDGQAKRVADPHGLAATARDFDDRIRRN